MEKRKKKKIIRKCVSLLLSFIFAMSAAAFAILLGCKVGVFNSSIIVSELNHTQYYGHISEDLYENMCDIIRPSGLPESVLDGVVDGDRVYMDAKKAIEAELSGGISDVDTSFVEETFLNNIDTYIKDEKISVNDETKQGLLVLQNQITDEYKRMVEFPFAKYYVKYQTLFNKVVYIGLAVLLFIIVVCAVVLIKMQHWAHRGVRYISYSLLSAGLMTGLIPVALKLSGKYKLLNIADRNLYRLAIGIIEDDINIFIYLSLACLVLFGLSLGVIKTLKDRAVS